MKDFSELSDRELLDLGLHVLGVPILPNYFDDTHARRIRDRIEELGLIREYRHFLAAQIWPGDTPLDQFKGAYEFAFRFEQATPRQQCIAALQAVDATNQDQGEPGGEKS